MSEPLREVMAWLGTLRAEAETQARRHGSLRGPVRRRQRPWSRALDAVEAEREAVAS